MLVVSSFDEVTRWESRGPDQWVGSVPSSWMQGRGSYGGVVAALGLRSLQSLCADGRTPRSLHTSFFGPLRQGPARLRGEVVRRGRFLTHARAELEQGDGLQAQITMTFADARDSGVLVDGPARPERPGPDELQDMPYIEGLTPTFTQHFAYRWTDGAMPFSRSTEPKLGGWCRHRTAPGDNPHAAVLGLLDAWPAPVVSMFERPGPASSATWTTTFFEVPTTFDPQAWWWLGSEAVHARGGYAGMRGLLYAPDGRLAASLEQLVVMFDRPAV